MRGPVWAFTLLLLCGSSLAAAPISQNYLCVQGHEPDATNKLQTFIKQAVVDFFKNKRIALNSSTLQVSLSNSTQPGADGPPYISFTGGAAGSSGLSASPVAGIVAAQDGTKFNVLLSSGSDTQDAAEYRIVSTQRGFDREGNAIGRHCALLLSIWAKAKAPRACLSSMPLQATRSDRFGCPPGFLFISNARFEAPPLGSAGFAQAAQLCGAAAAKAG